MKTYQPVPFSFWWDVAQASPHATFFHTPLWHTLALAACPRCQEASLGIEWPNGVRAVLPLIRVPRSPGFHLLFSTFGGSYGGLIADGPLPHEASAQVYRQALTPRTLAFYLLASPRGMAAPPPAAFQAKSEFTHLLPLDQPPDQIIASFARSRRRDFRRGVRRGYTVHPAQTLADYRTYYAIYQEALARWGQRATVRYPWAFFAACQRLAQRYPENIRLWLAYVAGQPAAGSLVFYWQDYAVVWHGVTRTDMLARRVTGFLDGAIVTHAAEHGYRYLDFGPSGGHEGVARYKDGFNTGRFPLQRWRWIAPWLRPLRWIRRGFHA